MFRKPYNYGRYSPVHRRQSQRRILRKSLRFLELSGWVLCAVTAICILIGFLAGHQDKRYWFILAAVQFALAAACLTAHRLGQMLQPPNRAGNDVPKTPRRRSQRRSRGSRAEPAGVGAASNPRRAGDGVALIAVLILVTLIGALVLNTQVITRLAHRERAAALRTVLLRQAATEGVRGALRELANDEDLTVDHLDEPWAEPVEMIDPSGMTIRVEIVDENRFFDINNLSVAEQLTIRPAADILADVITLCGDYAPVHRVEALRDWIDKDDEGAHEVPSVQSEDLSRVPANRILLGWNELLRVDGFLREQFRRKEDLGIPDPEHGDLIDAVTIVPAARDGVIPINLNTAGRETIYGILGLENERLLERILDRRKQGPIRAEDAAQFSVDPDLIRQLGPYLTVNSEFFRVQATAFAGSHAETVRALVHRDREGNVAILSWVL